MCRRCSRISSTSRKKVRAARGPGRARVPFHIPRVHRVQILEQFGPEMQKRFYDETADTEGARRLWRINFTRHPKHLRHMLIVMSTAAETSLTVDQRIVRDFSTALRFGRNDRELTWRLSLQPNRRTANTSGKSRWTSALDRRYWRTTPILMRWHGND